MHARMLSSQRLDDTELGYQSDAAKHSRQLLYNVCKRACTEPEPPEHDNMFITHHM